MVEIGGAVKGRSIISSCSRRWVKGDIDQFLMWAGWLFVGKAARRRAWVFAFRDVVGRYNTGSMWIDKEIA
jgi:hypothetical protein